MSVPGIEPVAGRQATAGDGSPHGWMSDLGNGLKAARNEAGLSIRALAKVTGYSTSTIVRAEAGHPKLGLDILSGLAYALGLPLHISIGKADIVIKPGIGA